MYQKSLLITLALAAISYSQHLLAHAEHDKARFVSTKGIDQGKCDNPVRPCKTISYAITKANKGDKVLVASGQYPLNNESELFYLQSKLVPILGGYNRFDHYQIQNPDLNKTVITGVPQSMHTQLHQAGFRVVGDHKGQTISAHLKAQLARHQSLSKAQSNEPCVNGFAGNFACNNIDLVAHVPLPSGTSASDIWGHVDLNTGIEYAIMGLSNGTAVYQLANPSEPSMVGHIEGLPTTWRDIKVFQYFDDQKNAYQAYAYVTSESSNGIQILDLNNLPHSVELANTNYLVNSAHNVYIGNVEYSLNLALNDQQAKLHIVGSNNFGGAFSTFALTDPVALTKSYSPSTNNRENYTHDATSMLIGDQRATRDCVNPINGMCDVFIDFNENEIRIWDATLPQLTSELSAIGYNDVDKSSQYVHSGWWHENKRHIYVHDEWDETYGGLNTTLRVLDLNDLTSPQVVGKWTSDNASIDHNGFVRGNRYYMSNYERGLTVLDISDPINPIEVGFFDTFPSSNNASYNGAWGTYPYLPSGNILVSDINSGLYVLKDQTRADTATVSFSAHQYQTQRGERLTVSLQKPTAIAQAVTVDLMIQQANALQDRDFSLVNTSQTFTWEANDNAPKNIEFDILNTNSSQSRDFFIKLTNPSRGITLGAHHLSQINIKGIESQGSVGFIKDTLTVSEKQTDVSVILSRQGGTRDALTVTYSTQFMNASSDDVNAIEGTVTWEDGDNSNKTIRFSLLDDDEAEATELFKIILTHPSEPQLISNNEITITIMDDENNQAPSVFAGSDVETPTNVQISIADIKVDDVDDSDLIYLWEHISGAQISIDDSTKLNPVFTTHSTTGDALLRLTVTDIHNASASDDVIITVIAPPEPEPPTTSSSGGSFPLSLLVLMLTLTLRHLRRTK